MKQPSLKSVADTDMNNGGCLCPLLTGKKLKTHITFLQICIGLQIIVNQGDK